jgi:hypothetical protein
MYTYTVTDKKKDPANGNIVVTVNFVDDANPSVVYTQQTWAFDLTDAVIDDWARRVIATFVARDAAFDGITLNTPKAPSAIDPAVQAAQDAQAALDAAIADAALKKTVADLANNDPAVQTAYDNFQNAQTTLSAKSVQVAV